MTESIQLAVRAVLEFLADVTRSRAAPDAAMQRLRELATAHPGIHMQLLWNTEAYDESVHYDVLVHPDHGDTVSVSLSSNHALPWPLRGIQRWTEANLVQVNGQTLTVEGAIGLLDVLWNEAPVMERMVNACLIREQLARDPITVDPEELQSGMDALRRAHRLYTVEDTERWMQQRGMTQVRLEAMVSQYLTDELLRKRIVADRVAGYVADHLRDLDVARVARIEFSDLASATEFRARLSGGVPGFLAAMHKAFVSGGTATGCNFVAIRRCDAASELGAQVFAAAPGDAVGPLRSGASSYAVGCLLQVDLARDGEATRAAAEQILFDQWLAQRRNEATTTWHWGRTPDTV